METEIVAYQVRPINNDTGAVSNDWSNVNESTYEYFKKNPQYGRNLLIQVRRLCVFVEPA